ncbi:PepSY-associated TM helix domain-containing protein [Gordonia sp. NPDC003424]
MTTKPPVDTDPSSLDASGDRESAPTTTPGNAGQSAWNRWRPLLLRWHFYAGLFVGPFLLVAALSGVLYALIPQVDAAVYRHELVVDDPGTAQLPLSDQVARARAAQPDGTLASITPPPTATDSTRVTFAVDGLPESYVQTVFVDPYSGEVLGNLTTLGQWLPVRAWFDELHRNLHLGAVGRNYSELAASWLWFVSLGGLVLWIGYRRRTKTARRLLVPDRSAPRRRRLLTLHGAVGIWVVVGLLALSVSGLTWSRWAGANVADLRSELSWTTPAASTTLGEPAAGSTGHHGGGSAKGEPASADAVESAAIASVNGVYRTAQQAGLRGPMVLTPPADSDSAWTVGENKRSFPTRYDSISVDPQTYTVLDRIDFAQWPFMAKLADWIIGAHMGILFGVVNQIALAALGIGLITLIVVGYLMWWRRRPTKSQRTWPAPPRRGALGDLKPAESVAVVVVIALLGWFLPLFGLTLALFVIADSVVGVVRSRREPVESPGT